MLTLFDPRRSAAALALAVLALLVSGCAQISTERDPSTMGGPGASTSADQPVGGRAVLRPVPPGQNLPGGDSTGSP